MTFGCRVLLSYLIWRMSSGFIGLLWSWHFPKYTGLNKKVEHCSSEVRFRSRSSDSTLCSLEVTSGGPRWASAPHGDLNGDQPQMWPDVSTLYGFPPLQTNKQSGGGTSDHVNSPPVRWIYIHSWFLREPFITERVARWWFSATHAPPTATSCRSLSGLL